MSTQLSLGIELPNTFIAYLLVRNNMRTLRKQPLKLPGCNTRADFHTKY